jgi:hypothetical protein
LERGEEKVTIPTERRGATRYRLQEAEFFLALLKKHHNHAMKFDFYLNAFLSAARSVLLVMHAEYDKVDGWKKWYDAKEVDSEEEKRLLKGTTKARDRTLKREPIRTLGGIAVAGPYTETGEEGEAAKLMDRIVRERVPASIFGTTGKITIEAVVDGQPVKFYVRKAIFKRQLAEFPGEKVPDVCKRYYDWLAKIVGECESKFGH